MRRAQTRLLTVNTSDICHCGITNPLLYNIGAYNIQIVYISVISPMVGFRFVAYNPFDGIRGNDGIRFLFIFSDLDTTLIIITQRHHFIRCMCIEGQTHIPTEVSPILVCFLMPFWA